MIKRREVVIPRNTFSEMRQHLLRDPGLEQLGFLLAGVSQSPERLQLLVRDFIPVPKEGLAKQTGTYLEAKPEFVQGLLRRCAGERLSLVEVHSHPFCDMGVSLSSTDVASEWEKFPYVASKIAEIHHATLVLGQRSVDGHIWSREEQYILPITGIRIIGCPVEEMTTTGWEPVLRSLVRWKGLPPGQVAVESEGQRFSRQVDAFGVTGQRRLAQATVAVVGVSGVGSHVVQQLAYLGVRHFVLVDPDVVSGSNLNRMVGATSRDVGRRKVDVARELIHAIAPGAHVVSMAMSVEEPEVLHILKQADLLMGCTDTQRSRLVLNSLATRYLLPYLDCGTGIERRQDGTVGAMGGQVRLVLPELPCLECLDGIDKEAVQREAVSAEELEFRANHGYGLGAEAPAPAVVFLNGVVASMAVGECFNLFVGYREAHPYLFYDHLEGRATKLTAQKRPDCVACGAESPAALGDLEPIRVNRTSGEVPSLVSGTEGV